MIDLQLWKLECQRCEGHCHAMVFIGVDRLKGRLAGIAFPDEGVVILVANDITHFSELSLQCLYTVGLLDLQCGKTGETEVYSHRTTGYYDGLCQVWRTREIVVKAW